MFDVVLYDASSYHAARRALTRLRDGPEDGAARGAKMGLPEPDRWSPRDVTGEESPNSTGQYAG